MHDITVERSGMSLTMCEHVGMYSGYDPGEKKCKDATGTDFCQRRVRSLDLRWLAQLMAMSVATILPQVAKLKPLSTDPTSSAWSQSSVRPCVRASAHPPIRLSACPPVHPSIPPDRPSSHPSSTPARLHPRPACPVPAHMATHPAVRACAHGDPRSCKGPASS